jgi:hypothetical protein
MGTTGGNAPTFAPPMWQGQARPVSVFLHIRFAKLFIKCRGF